MSPIHPGRVDMTSPPLTQTTEASDSPPTVFVLGLVLATVGATFNGINRTLTRSAVMVGGSGRAHDGRGGGRFAYLRSATWWLGMLCMVCGDGSTFAALALAPSALISPVVGSLTVFCSVLLARVYLSERLTTTGSLGCVLSVVGVVTVVTNAPRQGGVRTLPDLTRSLYSPHTLLYLAVATALIWYLVCRVSAQQARSNVLVLATTGAAVSSLLVTAAKVLSVSAGGALTLPEADGGGDEVTQWHDAVALLLLSIIVCVFCMLAGIHTITLLLSHFPTPLVVSTTFPLYTAGQMLGTAIVFNEWSGESWTQMLNCACGFVTSAIAVFMMQLS